MQGESFILSPKLTLAAFASRYINEVMPKPATPKQQRQRASIVRGVTRLFREWLHREPLVSDLERSVVVEFLRSRGNEDGNNRCRNFLCTMRKQAILANLLSGKPGQPLLKESKWYRVGSKSAISLDEAEGGLWDWCQRYFKSNLSIRSAKTVDQYKISLRYFQKFLGRPAKPEDLTEENVVGMMKMLADQQDQMGRRLSPRTVNEKRNRIRALWEWLARKKVVEQFPTVGQMQVPKRTPRAWTGDQLSALFTACRSMPGHIAGVNAGDWWLSLHLVGWDTAERIGALLQARKSHLDFDRGVLSLPAEIRKGGQSDAVYTLHVETLALLLRMQEPQRDLIWPWPLSTCQFYNHYRSLLHRAGLPHERGVGFHKMRKSVASHLAAGGHNATEALGHSTSHVTKASYLDPSIANRGKPAQLLFRPTDAVPGVANPDIEALNWL